MMHCASKHSAYSGCPYSLPGASGAVVLKPFRPSASSYTIGHALRRWPWSMLRSRSRNAFGFCGSSAQGYHPQHPWYSLPVPGPWSKLPPGTPAPARAVAGTQHERGPEKWKATTRTSLDGKKDQESTAFGNHRPTKYKNNQLLVIVVILPPPFCISYANVHNYYGPYAYCSLDKGVACAQHIQLPTHRCAGHTC